MLFRRRQCVFIAFDLLYLNGKDLRTLRLIERKAMLKNLLRRKRSRILYLDHVESDGRLLFEQIVAMDLEGIVCKRKDLPYKVTEKPSRYWIKVKYSRYSQLEGREELFERVRCSHAQLLRIKKQADFPSSVFESSHPSVLGEFLRRENRRILGRHNPQLV